MKLIIKNDSKETVKNPNVKIIETTEASFVNQIVILESNDVPIIKYTDTESMYFVKDLDNLYDRKSKSEVLLNITTDNLELIGGGSSEPVDPRPYKVYTALLTQSGTNAPVATVLENTLGGEVVWSRDTVGQYEASSSITFTQNTIGYVYNVSTDAIDTAAPTGVVRLGAGNKILLTTADGEGNKEDDLLFYSSIEIRVYN